MSRPTLVYDDDCGFCKWSVAWLNRTDAFETIGFSDLTAEQLDRLDPGFENCMHLLTDEGTFSCGEALERSLEETGTVGAAIVAVARHLPGWTWIRERGYRWVADRRAIWARYRARERV